MTTPPEQKRKWFKSPWFYIPTGLLVLLLAVVAVLVHQLENIIESNIRTALANEKEMAYRIDFESLRIRLLENSIKLKGIRVNPKNELIKQREEEGVYKSFTTHAQVETVSLKGLDWEKLITEKKVHLNQLVIIKPDMDIYLTGKKQPKKVTDTLSLAEQISSTVQLLDSIHVQEVLIRKGVFELYSPDSERVLEINNLGLEMIGADYDTTHSDRLPVKFEKLLFSMGSAQTSLGEEYVLSTGDIQLNYTDSSFKLNDLAIKSKFNRKEFTKRSKYERTQLDLETALIEGKGIDMERIIIDQYIHVRSLAIDQVNFKGFKDKTPPWNTRKKHPILSQLIKKIPFLINVKQVHVANSDILFELVMPEHEKPGKLYFSECFASLYNITNDPELLEESDRLTVDFASKMMHSGKLNVNLQFDLSGRADRFYVKGQLDKMPLQKLNDELEPLIGIEVSSGILHSAQIDISGNFNDINGTVNLHYNDIQIDILKLKPDAEGKSSKFFSFIANAVVRTNNVPGTESYKEGYVHYTRSPDIPFFKFLWEGIFSGIKNTLIGIKSKEEKEMSKKRSGQSDTKDSSEEKGINKLFKKLKKKK
ncbi:hypothetical protein KFE98_16295 [bacterium SCSIO 12741]|nr:hypothetical protein KFE98_16295 [bacterium SCSIO 12741]